MAKLFAVYSMNYKAFHSVMNTLFLVLYEPQWLFPLILLGASFLGLGYPLHIHELINTQLEIWERLCISLGLCLFLLVIPIWYSKLKTLVAWVSLNPKLFPQLGGVPGSTWVSSSVPCFENWYQCSKLRQS